MRTVMKLELECQIELPSLPNFIKAIRHPEPNSIAEQTIPVEDISDEQLRIIGTEWVKALIEHAQSRRNKVKL